MNKVIAASAIGRKFGNTRALENVSFDISESEIFGFIGPDGKARGRPVGVLFDPRRKALYVADDLSNTVWRVTPAATTAAARP